MLEPTVEVRFHAFAFVKIIDARIDFGYFCLFIVCVFASVFDFFGHVIHAWYFIKRFKRTVAHVFYTCFCDRDTLFFLVFGFPRLVGSHKLVEVFAIKHLSVKLCQGDRPKVMGVSFAVCYFSQNNK